VGGGGARGAGPARYWRLDEPGGGPARRFGIISAMTEHFCDACNRVRLSAAGALHACLGFDDAVNLRDVLRSDGEAAVIAAIHRAVSAKRPGHTFGLLGIGGPRKSMISIGG
jgi:cyclic pyranopterin phosphate synthase